MNKEHTQKQFRGPLALVLAVALVLGGCAGMSKTERGAATGAGAGAAAGAVIGKVTGNAAKGAIIGAVLGGTAGAVIGQQMDKQAEELEGDLEGAQVERVGEGIQITFDSAILFGYDSSELMAPAKANLRDLAASLAKYPNTEIMIVGHTDDRGSDSYNQTLSEQRARAAAQYLQSQGVARARVTTLGKGEMEPVASNATDSGRSQNRRVEIAIYASDEFREQVGSRN